LSSPAIVQIVPSLNTGGAERTTIDVAEALHAAGFKALVASEGGRMEAELTAKGGELIRLPLNVKAPHKLIANARRLQKLIVERDVKIVHARSRAPAWSALWAARLAHVPFVTTYHGIYNASNPLKRFYNSVMKRGDVVIANSEWTAAHIEREYKTLPNKPVVIPRGIDLSRFDPAGIPPAKVAALRAQWGTDERDFVAMLPGRLTRWKGQMLVIEAAAQLKMKHLPRKLRVIFAGDAQGRNAYEAELLKRIADTGIADCVRIVGHIEDMATAYAAADLVVSASSDPEAFGRVAAEASAMARPVIAADHGGARETVVGNVSGILFPPGNALALADAIEHVMRITPDALSDMGRAGRTHIANNYSLERMCCETIGLYRELLAR
jgi:glycosyltransferase involved in cell wall biosynthesis